MTQVERIDRLSQNGPQMPVAIEPLESRAMLSAAADAAASHVLASLPLPPTVPAPFSVRIEVAFSDQASRPEPLHGELPTWWRPDVEDESTEAAEAISRGQHHHGFPPPAVVSTAMLFGILAIAPPNAPVAPPTPQALPADREERIESFRGNMHLPGFVLPPGLVMMRVADAGGEHAVSRTTQSAGRTPAAVESGEKTKAPSRNGTVATEVLQAPVTIAPAPLKLSSSAGVGETGVVRFRPESEEPTIAQRLAMKLAAVFADQPIVDLLPTETGASIKAAASVTAATSAIVVPAATAVASIAPEMFYFPRLGSASSFMFDSIAALTDEFALAAAEPAATESVPSRAVMVTAAVLAADVVLLTIVFRRKSGPRRFSRQPVLSCR